MITDVAGAHFAMARNVGGGAMPRFDASNIGGLTALMNPQNIDTTKSGKDVEHEIMGRHVDESKETRRMNIVDAYGKEMQSLADELGFDLDDDDDLESVALGNVSSRSIAESISRSSKSAKSSRARSKKSSTHSRASSSKHKKRQPVESTKKSFIPKFDSSWLDSSDDESNATSNSSAGSVASSANTDSDDDLSGSGSGASSSSSEDEYSDQSEADTDSDGIMEESAATQILRGLEQDLGINLSESAFESTRRITHIPSSTAQKYTAEQEKRRHIDQVLGGLREDSHRSYDAHRERMQDEISNKLEQITSLKLALEEDMINCDDIKIPNSASPIEEIDSVLRTLRLKNDRNRCATVAEEIILGMGEVLEGVFDGTRELPIVGYKPDFTDYTNTLRVKLHRMRFDTAQIVSDVVQKHNMGPKGRMAMELLPSLILYPRQRKQQRGRTGLASDPRMSARVRDSRAAQSSIRARESAAASSRSVLDGL